MHSRLYWLIVVFVLGSIVMTACAAPSALGPAATSVPARTSVPTTAPTTVPTTVPTNTPTTVPITATVPIDWTTYTSPHYGYAIDYPTAWVSTPAKRDWHSDGSVYPDDDAVDKWTAPINPGDIWILMFVSSVSLAQGETTADRIAKLDHENAQFCELGHRHDVTIDGVAARQEDGKCWGRDYMNQIAVVHSGRSYLIYLLSGGPFSGTSLATFNHFAGSFRFVSSP